MPPNHISFRLALAAALLLAPQLASAAAPIADDASLTRMALCRDSWLDWQKAHDPRLEKLAEHFRAGFTPNDNDPFYLPKAPLTIAGFRVLQLYPGSVGMGVGFSVLVDAPFDAAKQNLEHTLGKPFKKCEAGDGMKTCELEIAPQRTFTLMAEDSPKNHATLIGCYYYYEK